MLAQLLQDLNCLVTHLAVSKTCPLCPWVHVNSKRDAWYNRPIEKIINIYNCKDDETKSEVTRTSADLAYLKKPDTTVAKTKKRNFFRCSICEGWKSAPAQKCSFPCTEGAM